MKGHKYTGRHRPTWQFHMNKHVKRNESENIPMCNSHLGKNYGVPRRTLLNQTTSSCSRKSPAINQREKPRHDSISTTIFSKPSNILRLTYKVAHCSKSSGHTSEQIKFLKYDGRKVNITADIWLTSGRLYFTAHPCKHPWEVLRMHSANTPMQAHAPYIMYLSCSIDRGPLNCISCMQTGHLVGRRLNVWLMVTLDKWILWRGRVWQF